MKKLVLTILTFTLAFGAINAQGRSQSHRQDQYHRNENSYKHQRGGNRDYQTREDNDEYETRGSNRSYSSNINSLYDQLNLSPDQRARAEQINSRLRYDMQSLRSNTSISPDQKRQEMMYLIQRNSSEFRSILNYQQAQQYDYMVSQMRQRAQQRNGSYGSDQDRYGRTQDPYGYGQPGDNSNNNQSNLFGGNASLLNILGGNLSLGSLLGSNFNLGNILGGNSNISLTTLLNLLSSLRQFR